MTWVVLASASPRRRELLAALVRDFQVEDADIPEPLGPDPRESAIDLAAAKARAVLLRQPAALVIGADTIVHDGARPYGKPSHRFEAVSMLFALRGRTHTVYTGVTVASSDRLATDVSESKVTLSALSDAAIDQYVASGSPLDKAGAYAIQDEHVPTVSKLEGCYCGVVGLPLWRLRALLEAAGCSPGDPSATYARCASCPDCPKRFA